jgi:hypothetical protein
MINICHSLLLRCFIITTHFHPSVKGSQTVSNLLVTLCFFKMYEKPFPIHVGCSRPVTPDPDGPDPNNKPISTGISGANSPSDGSSSSSNTTLTAALASITLQSFTNQPSGNLRSPTFSNTLTLVGGSESGSESNHTLVDSPSGSPSLPATPSSESSWSTSSNGSHDFGGSSNSSDAGGSGNSPATLAMQLNDPDEAPLHLAALEAGPDGSILEKRE